MHQAVIFLVFLKGRKIIIGHKLSLRNDSLGNIQLVHSEPRRNAHGILFGVNFSKLQRVACGGDEEHDFRAGVTVQRILLRMRNYIVPMERHGWSLCGSFMGVKPDRTVFAILRWCGCNQKW